MGVANPWSLASIIRRNIPFEVTEQPEILMEKLNNLKATKKNGLIYVCSGVALMFVIVFVTVFLTGEREMHEFSNIDWTIFAIMVATEIATAVATFYFAGKTGKNNIPIEKLQYEIVKIFPLKSLERPVFMRLYNSWCYYTSFIHPTDDTGCFPIYISP